MDLQDMKKEKNALAEGLKELLNAFENRTSTTIYNISLDRVGVMGTGNIICSVGIEVRL